MAMAVIPFVNPLGQDFNVYPPDYGDNNPSSDIKDSNGKPFIDNLHDLARVEAVLNNPQFQTYLAQRYFAMFLPPPAHSNTYDAILRDGGRKISLSSVEDQSVVHYENKYPVIFHPVSSTVVIDIKELAREIKAQIDTGVAVNTAIFNVGVAYDLHTGGGAANLDKNIVKIDLGPSEQYLREMDSKDRKRVGLFILNFFNTPTGENYSTNSTSETWFVQDATSPSLDKIFAGVEQAKNLITAVKIADSAGTLDNFYGEKKQQKYYYGFPGREQGDNTQFYYHSNVLSSDAVKIKLVYTSADPGDSRRENRANFQWQFIFNNQLDGQYMFPLQFMIPDQCNGPSIEYLGSIINLLLKPRLTPYPSDQEIQSTWLGNMIDLSPLIIHLKRRGFSKEKIIDLLLDLKRGGDWEQCNMSKYLHDNTPGQSVIMCSRDRLCVKLYSRLIQQSCISDLPGVLTLYRYHNNIDPVLGVLRSFEYLLTENDEQTEQIGMLRTYVANSNGGERTMAIALRELYDRDAPLTLLPRAVPELLTPPPDFRRICVNIQKLIAVSANKRWKDIEIMAQIEPLVVEMGNGDATADATADAAVDDTDNDMVVEDDDPDGHKKFSTLLERVQQDNGQLNTFRQYIKSLTEVTVGTGMEVEGDSTEAADQDKATKEENKKFVISELSKVNESLMTSINASKNKQIIEQLDILTKHMPGSFIEPKLPDGTLLPKGFYHKYYGSDFTNSLSETVQDKGKGKMIAFGFAPYIHSELQEVFRFVALAAYDKIELARRFKTTQLFSQGELDIFNKLIGILPDFLLPQPDRTVDLDPIRKALHDMATCEFPEGNDLLGNNIAYLQKLYNLSMVLDTSISVFLDINADLVPPPLVTAGQDDMLGGNPIKKGNNVSKRNTRRRKKLLYHKKINNHTSKKHTAKKHTSKKHTAKKHTAKKHTAKKHTAKKHTAKKHISKKHTLKKHISKKHVSKKHNYTKKRILGGGPVEIDVYTDVYFLFIKLCNGYNNISTDPNRMYIDDDDNLQIDHEYKIKMSYQLATDLCSEIYALFPTIDLNEYKYIVTEETRNIIAIIFYFKEVIDNKLEAINSQGYESEHDQGQGYESEHDQGQGPDYEDHTDEYDTDESDADEAYSDVDGGGKRKSRYIETSDKKRGTKIPPKKSRKDLIDADDFLGYESIIKDKIVILHNILDEKKINIFDLLSDIYGGMYIDEEYIIVNYSEGEPFPPDYRSGVLPNYGAKRIISNDVDETFRQLLPEKQDNNDDFDGKTSGEEYSDSEDDDPDSEDDDLFDKNDQFFKRRPRVRRPRVTLPRYNNLELIDF